MVSDSYFCECIDQHNISISAIWMHQISSYSGEKINNETEYN
jgi:hypothetical protein